MQPSSLHYCNGFNFNHTSPSSFEFRPGIYFLCQVRVGIGIWRCVRCPFTLLLPLRLLYYSKSFYWRVFHFIRLIHCYSVQNFYAVLLWVREERKPWDQCQIKTSCRPGPFKGLNRSFFTDNLWTHYRQMNSCNTQNKNHTSHIINDVWIRRFSLLY